MIAWRLYGLILLAGVVVWAVWWVAQADVSPKVVAVVAVVGLTPVVYVAYQEFAWQRNESRYTKVVAPIAAEAVVRCQRFTEALLDLDNYSGHVVYTADGRIDTVAHLDRDVCNDLARLPRQVTAASVDEVAAVHVLVHEAEHVAGVITEAEADCYAIQHTPEVAVRLGYGAEAGQEWALRYLREVYPRMSETYRNTTACAPGGQWDLRVAGFRWG